MVETIISRLINDLRAARTDELRLRLARRLREIIRTEARVGTAYFSSTILSILNTRLSELVTSTDSNDKLAGIFAIYELTDEPLPDNETKIARFATFVRSIPPTTTEPLVLRATAKAIGHLAKAGGALTSEFVEFEVKRALEWLQVVEPRIESRKLASVYILRELFEYAPTLTYPYLSIFFSHIWVGLSDPKINVREASAKTLGSALTLVASRYSRFREQWYNTLYNTARGTLAGNMAIGSGSTGNSGGMLNSGNLNGGMGNTGTSTGSGTNSTSRVFDMIHGALLTLGELLTNSAQFADQSTIHSSSSSSISPRVNNGNNESNENIIGNTPGGATTFLASRFNELCEMILKYRDSRDKIVRKTVAVLLPRLAHFHPEAFVRNYAEISLAHLLGILKDPKQIQDRGLAYVAVGRIALAIGYHLSSDSLRPQLERIIDAVREGLQAQGNNNTVSNNSTGSNANTSSGTNNSNSLNLNSNENPNKTHTPEALACVAMLARAVGPALTDYCHSLIDPMFSDGLSPILAEALTAISSAIPVLKSLLQERLLHELSIILSGKPFIPPYAGPIKMDNIIYNHNEVSTAMNDDGFYEDDVGGLSNPWQSRTYQHNRVREPFNAYGMLPTSLALSSLVEPTRTDGNATLINLKSVLTTGGITTTSGVGLAAASNSSSISSNAPNTNSSLGLSLSFGFGNSNSNSNTTNTNTNAPSSSWAKYLSSSTAGYADNSTGTNATGNNATTGVSNTNSSFIHPFGSTNPYDQTTTITLARSRGVPNNIVCLALHTLGTFDLASIPLLPFVRETVLPYFDDEDPGIRLEASLTAARLLVRPSELMGDESRLDPLFTAAMLEVELDYEDFTEGNNHRVGNTVPSPQEPQESDEFSDEDDDDSDDEDEYCPRPNGSSKRQGIEGYDDNDDEEKDIVGADVLGPVALLRASLRSSNAVAHPLVQREGNADDSSFLASSKRSSSRRKMAKSSRIRFLSRYARLSRPVSHPLLVLGTDVLSVGMSILGMGEYISPITSAVGATAAILNKGGISKTDIIRGLVYGATSILGTGPTLIIVTQIIQRLVMMSITDSDPAIRFELLRSLDSRFDPLLTEPETLRLFFVGLYDENQACREATLALVGRLTAHNPSMILPALRRTLLTLLAELEYADAHPDVTPPLVGITGIGSVFRGPNGNLSTNSTTNLTTRANLLTSGQITGTGETTTTISTGTGPTTMEENTTISGKGLSSPASATARLSAYHTGAAQEVILAAASGGGGRDHAARMIGLLIRSAQRLVAPYAPVLLRALLPQAWGTAPGKPLLIGNDLTAPLPLTVSQFTATASPELLTAAVMSAIGELSAVCAEALVPHLHILVPLIVDGLTQAAHSLGIGSGITTNSATLEDVLGLANPNPSNAQRNGPSTSSSSVTSSALNGSAASISNAPEYRNRRTTTSGMVVGSSGVPSYLPYVVIATGTNPVLFIAVAVRTLGLLVENTGSPIVPYLDHPHLLGLLLALLARAPTTIHNPFHIHSSLTNSSSAGMGITINRDSGLLASSTWSMRREVLRTLGLLGALDPYRYRMAQIAQAQRAASAVQATVQARLLAAVSMARLQGRKLGSARLLPEYLRKGVKPGIATVTPFILDDDGIAANGMPHVVNQTNNRNLNAVGITVAGVDTAPVVFGNSTTTMDGFIGVPWDLSAHIPTITGLALGGGAEVDPMEAALAGLAGEPGAYVGVNIDEVGLGIGALTGAYALGFGGYGGNANLFGEEGGLGNGNNVLDMYGMGNLLGKAGGGSGGDTTTNPPIGGDTTAVRNPTEILPRMAASTLLPSMVNNLAEFAPTVALTALLNMLNEENAILHHPAVLQAIVNILRSLGSATRCIPLLPRIVPAFLTILRAAVQRIASGVGGTSTNAPSTGASSTGATGGTGTTILSNANLPMHNNTVAPEPVLDSNGTGAETSGGTTGVSSLTGDSNAALRDTVIEQLTILLYLVKEHMRPWLATMFSLVRELWPVSLVPSLRLIEAVAAVLGDEARPYIVSFIPHMLSILAHDGTRPVYAPAVLGHLFGKGMNTTGNTLPNSLTGFTGLYVAADNTIGIAPLTTLGGNTATPSGGMGNTLGLLVTTNNNGTVVLGPPPGGIPSSTRMLTRHVLHTIAILIAGGRRALYGGHRHLLDDHIPVLIPAISRLIDAGINTYNGSSGNNLTAYNGSGSTSTLTLDEILASTIDTNPLTTASLSNVTSTTSPWISSGGIPSNSSSLAVYGPVAPAVRRQAIDTVTAIAASGVDLTLYAARLVQPLARTLADNGTSSPSDVKRAALDCLCILLLQLREQYVIWIPLIRKACVYAAIAEGYSTGSGNNGNDQGNESRVLNRNPSTKESSRGQTNSASSNVSAIPLPNNSGGVYVSGASTGGGIVSSFGIGGISGTGAGAVNSVRHETYERLVALLLGFGPGYGMVADEEFALYGYGIPVTLPLNPIDVANLLHDPGTCGRDGSGPRLASTLTLSNTYGIPATNPSGTTTINNRSNPNQQPTGIIAHLLGEVRGEIGLLNHLTMDDDNFAIGGIPHQFDGFGTFTDTNNPGSSTSGASRTGSDPKLHVGQDALKRVWETSGRSTKEDWAEWMRRLAVELLRESPAPSLRACCSLAQVYGPLASELFNAAFLTLWNELFEEYQESLLQSLESAFIAGSVPTQVLQALLSLAEFMEHADKALPTDVRKLAALAERVGAAAKALHYREMQFQALPGDATTIEHLMEINNLLDQPEAAVGVLKYAQQGCIPGGRYGFRAAHTPLLSSSTDAGMDVLGGSDAYAAIMGTNSNASNILRDPYAVLNNPDASDDTLLNATTSSVGGIGTGISIEVQESWYEKLGRWDDALEAYERKQEDMPTSLALVLGRMRCLKALGEWQKLNELARDAWPRLEGNIEGRAAVAPLAARAAWALGQWSDLKVYLGYTTENSQQGSLYRAIYAVHNLNFDEASHHIDNTRKLLANEMSGLLQETYSRAYSPLVTAQLLSEMEEILTYLRLAVGGNSAGAITYITHLRSLWTSRMRGVSRSVDTWSRLLAIRSLITLASESMGEWLQFASLCRRTGRMNMALKVLLGLGERKNVVTNSGTIRIPGVSTITEETSTGSNTNNRGALPTLLRTLNNSSTVGNDLSSKEPDYEYEQYVLNAHSLTDCSRCIGANSGAHPRVIYAYCKHLWYNGYKEEAVSQLRILTKAVDDSIEQRRQAVDQARQVSSSSGLPLNGNTNPAIWPGKYGRHQLEPRDENALRVQCHLRLGQWLVGLMEPIVNNYASGTTNSSSTVNSSVMNPNVNSVPLRATISTDIESILQTNAGTVPFASTHTVSGGNRTRTSSTAYAELVAPVLASFRVATHDCGERGHEHYRSWHAWALANFTAAQYHAESLRIEREKDRERIVATNAGKTVKSGNLRGPSSGTIGEPKGSDSTSDIANETTASSASGTNCTSPVATAPFPIAAAVTAHAVAAIKAFFRSIALGRTRLKAYILQDLLRLLTAWFAHGEAPAVQKALAAGLDSGAVSVDVWLQVIPQLIARIHIPGTARATLLRNLLSRIGNAHPQALVYPLTVATKSASKPRRDAAHQVLTTLRRRYPILVDQADTVSQELIRVAILWPELWQSALEEASRSFFGDGNPQAMLDVLLPLHEMMSNPGPQTQREVAFLQQFGRELDTAHGFLRIYARNLAAGVPRDQCAGDASAAWDVYFQLFRKINRLLPNITSLELHSVSPKLLSAYDLELGVPGTYTAGAPVVRIMTFCPAIDVIASKQRPRKTTMQGSDGRQYTFLLKGHEDLRQDERVMQLFGLVNTLLANDYDTSHRDLSIRRYAVTPLSHTAGVVGWVPATDTLHALIREYRDARKILLNIEHRLMCQMAPMYDSLTILQKVEVFRYALDNTQGQDLYKVLWLKSPSSEVWLERRTNYTRSLAVMSIVGYVLGLGDRHPSNLMLDRGSGKILHIDFGDCFEVAMTREKFPERVPFRLTRLLVNAMEACGIEGSYRSTAEAVTRVLRQHRDSAMAMLEAFVHDPLINWRLLGGGVGGTTGNTAASTTNNTNRSTTNTNNGAVLLPATVMESTTTTTTNKSGSNNNNRPPTVPSIIAGVNSLAGNDSLQARTFTQQGLAFAREMMEAASVVTGPNALLNGGIGTTNGGGTAFIDTSTNAAIARSLAASMRGPRTEREKELLQNNTLEGSSTAVNGGGNVTNAPPTEVLNARAVAVLRRIQAKLTGRDFSDDDPIGQLMSQGAAFASSIDTIMNNSNVNTTVNNGTTTTMVNNNAVHGGINIRVGQDGSLDVAAQVQRLILAATSHENLCQCYIGWCPFW